MVRPLLKHKPASPPRPAVLAGRLQPTCLQKSTNVTEKTEVLNGLKFEACKGNQNLEYLQDFMDFC